MKKEFLSTQKQAQRLAKRTEHIARLKELGWFEIEHKWGRSKFGYTYNLDGAIALEKLRGNIKPGRKAK